MRIDHKLNLVIPVERDDGSTVYVHSAPIARQAFEAYFIEISRTFTAIMAGGHGSTSGPRIAALMLRKIAMDTGRWEGEGGVEQGFMSEVRRLSNVVAPREGGWGLVPMQEAIDRKFFSEDDVSEVENALVFFTVASSMLRRKELEGVLEAVCGLWGARTESLNCSEFAASLTKSTPAESPGEPATALSIPH